MLIQHYHPLSLPSIDVVKPQLSAEVRTVRVGWVCGLSGSESCRGGGVVSVEVRAVRMGVWSQWK